MAQTWIEITQLEQFLLVPQIQMGNLHHGDIQKRKKLPKKMTVSSEIQSFRQKFLNLNVVTQIESKEDDKKEQCDHNHCQEEPNLQGWHLIPSFFLPRIHLVL